MFKTLGFDPDKDLTVVSGTSSGVLPVVVHKSLPAEVKDLKSFIEYAKKNKVNFGSWALVSSAHIFAQTLNEKYGLTMEDLRTAVGDSNSNGAKGNFDGPTQAITIGANDQLLTSDAYRQVVIAYRNNAAVRLSDVATVEDDAENVRQAAWANGKPAVIVNVQRQPGANTIAVVDSVLARFLVPRVPSDPAVTTELGRGARP